MKGYAGTSIIVELAPRSLFPAPLNSEVERAESKSGLFLTFVAALLLQLLGLGSA